MNWRWPASSSFNPERPQFGGQQEVATAHSHFASPPRRTEIIYEQLVVETLFNQVLKGQGKHMTQLTAESRGTMLDPHPDVTRVITWPWQKLRGEMLYDVAVIWPRSTGHTDGGLITRRFRSSMKYNMMTGQFSLLNSSESPTTAFIPLLKPESMDELIFPADSYVATLYPKPWHERHPALKIGQQPNGTKTERFLCNVLSFAQAQNPYIPR